MARGSGTSGGRGPTSTKVLAPYFSWVLGLTLAYFALPGLHIFLWAMLGASSVVAILVGVRRNRPERPLPWYLLAAAVATFAAGDLTYNALTLIRHQDNPFPSVADGFYLAMYPVCAAALALFIRSRTPSADRDSLIDALIVTVGLGLLSWVYLIEPSVSDDGLTLQQKLTSISYPLGDVILLAMLARLLSAGGSRCRSMQMLTVGTVGLLTADVLYGLIQLNGTWAVGGPVDAGWVLFYVLLGAAALHPSMRGMTQVLPPRPVGIGRWRLLLIGAASLIAPADALAQAALGHHDGLAVFATSSALLFALVMARMSGVVRAHQRGLDRERTLQTAGASLVAASDEARVADAVRRALRHLTVGESPMPVAVTLLDPDELRSVPDGARLPLATVEPLMIEGLSGRVPVLVPRAAVAALEPEHGASGTMALVLPLRSADAALGALLVWGDARELMLMRDAIQTLGFKVALALQRILLQRRIHERESEAHFRSLIQNASDVILVIGAENDIIYQTPSATRVLGFEPSELAGEPLQRLLHPDGLVASLALLDRIRQASSDHSGHCDWLMRCADGRWIDVEVVLSNLLDDPHVRGLVLTIRDVTQQRELEQELKHRAFHDSLTSLANRGLFADRLEHALRRGARLDTLVVVLFLDLDEFKVINDTRGHSVGDDILKHVAATLEAAIRSGDTAARLGGDEFALIIEDAGSIEEVEGLARRILQELREPVQIAGDAFAVRASIGIATNEHSHDAGELVQLADLALYEAKGDFKGGYRVYRPALRVEMLDRMQRIDLLQQAFEAGHFQLAYQPVVKLDSMRVVGLEALIRWHDPVRGVISPDKFIPDAEESGLIVPLGEWVLRQAVEQAHAWQQAHPLCAPLRINVNVSGRQVREPGFVDTVASALRDFPLHPRTLVLELTESLLIEDNGVAEVLGEVSALGALFALDDFGTGYSALGYLRRFPIDILKLDKSFVDDLLVSSSRGALVEAIIHLAQTLELGLVVEGIETTAQAERLRAMGCQLGQGYLYGRPTAAAGIERLLDEQDQLLSTQVIHSAAPSLPRQRGAHQPTS